MQRVVLETGLKGHRLVVNDLVPVHREDGMGFELGGPRRSRRVLKLIMMTTVENIR